MDDKPGWNEKKSLGLTAKVLREKKELSQQEVADGLGVSRKRVSEIESGKKVSPENLQNIVKVVGAKTLHAMKVLDVVEYLDEEERRPLDPLGPTPRQEMVIYEASRELSSRFEAMMRDGCRRQNLEAAQRAAAEEWAQLRRMAPSERVAAIRRNHPSAQTWIFCQFLCAIAIHRKVLDSHR